MFARGRRSRQDAAHGSVLPPPVILASALNRPRAAQAALVAPAGARGILAIAARGGAVVLVGLAAYIGVQVWLRTEWRQKRSIRKRLCGLEDVGPVPGSTSPGDTSSLWLSRPERLAFLKACIEGTPSGPLVVTGPEGSGKSTLLRQAVHGRPMCWWLDCREIPVTDGEQLLEAFIARTGFLPPPDELLGQVVFARGRDDGKSRREKDKALRLVTGVLRDVQDEQGEAVRDGAAEAATGQAADAKPGDASVARPAARSDAEAERRRQRHAAASVVEAMERARQRRDGGSEQRVAEQGWARSTIGAAALRSIERLAAVAPPWATQVVEAVRTGLAGTFAVELSEEGMVAAVSPLPPLICIDEAHIIGDPADSHLHALLDWFQYLTDQRLAHVVIGCSSDFAEGLDATRSFRARRQRIYVDFPRSVSVRGFLDGPVNAELERRARAARAAVALSKAEGAAPVEAVAAGLTEEEVAAFSELGDQDLEWLTSLPPGDLPGATRLRPLSEAEVGMVLQTAGGHMKDLDAIVRQLVEGHAVGAVLERMVADSVDSVESFIETTLLRGEPLMPGVAFAAKGSQPLKHKPGAGAGSDGGPAAMTERAWRFVRLWRLMEQLARRKYVSRRELTTGLFAGHGWELDELTKHGLVMCANLRSSRKLRASSPQSAGGTAPRDGHAKQSAEVLSPDAFAAATRYIAAASPRLRSAFRVITENRALREQSDRVTAMLRAGVLRHRLAELQARLSAAASERSYYAHRVEKFADTLDAVPTDPVPKQIPGRAFASAVSHGQTAAFSGKSDYEDRRRLLVAGLDRLEADALKLRQAIDDTQSELEEAEALAEGQSHSHLMLDAAASSSERA